MVTACAVRLTSYDLRVDALCLHIIQGHFNLDEDLPDSIIDLLFLCTTTQADDANGGRGAKTEWRKDVSDNELETLAEIVDEIETRVLTHGDRIRRLMDEDNASRKAIYSCDCDPRITSISNCLGDEAARQFEKDFAELRRGHCAAMRGQRPEQFTSKTSRDPGECMQLS